VVLSILFVIKNVVAYILNHIHQQCSVTCLSRQNKERIKLSTFEELLVMQTTQKAQQNRWMDPSKDWGQNGVLQGVKAKKTRGNG